MDVAIRSTSCIRCGACASIAPSVFALSSDSAYIVQQPRTPEEIACTNGAMTNCPVGAIVAADCRVEVSNE